MVALALLLPAGVLARRECALGPPIPDCGMSAILGPLTLLSLITIFFDIGADQAPVSAWRERCPEAPEALGSTA